MNVKNENTIASAYEEAQNVLKYVLQFKVNQSNKTSPDESGRLSVIDCAWQKTMDVCQPLLREFPVFFGYPCGQNQGLAGMCSYSSFSQVWGNMLRDEAVVSLYVWIRSLFDYEPYQSPYSFLAMMHYDNSGTFVDLNSVVGLDHLISDKKYRISETNGRPEIKEIDKTKRGKLLYTEEETEAGGFLRKTNHQFFISIEKLDSMFGGKINSYKKFVSGMNRNKLQISDLEIISILRTDTSDNDVSSTVAANSVFQVIACDRLTPKWYKNYISAIKSYREKIAAASFTAADRIYARYQLEKRFNFELIDCLWQNMAVTSNRVKKDLFLYGNLDCYADCIRLPNIFTRKYIMQFAFDSLLDTGLRNSDDFWDELSNPDVFGRYAKKENETDVAIPVWNTRFKKTIKYLSDFVFPVYRSTLFICLYDALCNSETSEVNTERFYTVLSDYLNQKGFEEELSKITGLNGNPDVIQENFESKGDDKALAHYKSCIDVVSGKSGTDNYKPLSAEDIFRFNQNATVNPILNYYMLCASGETPTIKV